MRRVFILLVFALLCLLCGSALAAALTNSISFSGKLTNAVGQPLSGTYSVTFRLYNVPSGGSALATDTHSVTTAATGLFTTSLAFPAGKFNGQGLWVSMQRAPDAEKTARTPIRPVPYAMSLRPGAIMVGSAGTLLNLQKSGDGRVLNILSTGTGGYGIYVNATGAAADAIFAQTSGESGMAIETISYGAESYGVSSTTMRNASTGVRAVAHGNHSAGISSSVDGRYSSGLRVETTGVFNKGIDMTVRGSHDNGLAINFSSGSGNAIHAIVHSGKSSGITVRTLGYESSGISSITSGESSQALGAHTSGNRSPGGAFSTTGSSSNGITVSTSGENSNGVLASTTKKYSPGLNVTTRGDNSPGVIAVTSGSRSHALTVKADGPISNGLRAESNQSYGVFGYSRQSFGVYANSIQSSGLYAITGRADHKYGVYTPDYIYAKGSQYPAVDVAEYFPAESSATPGTVMVIGPDGSLRPSSEAYDLRVAGIVSTDPAVSLGAKDSGNPGEVPLAVAGRVPCRVDASLGAIHPGDVLTTSTRAGYAMKAEPVEIAGVRIYRPGTVLGKALGTLESGTGMIEVLVSLQ